VTRVRRHAPFLLLCAAFFVLYAAMTVIRHERYESHGYDLGIFDQAIWHYSRFEAPGSTIRGFPDLLGDHFHPILVLAAPFLWIWDDVRVLLLLQVGLFVAASVPIYLLARERFGQIAGLLWAAAFLVFWGVQSAIDFDFHEVAFAIPLISFGLWLILKERFVPAAFCVGALLLVKEDLSFLVIGFGAVFLLYRRWWLGAGFIVGGLGWFLVVTKLLMPRLSPGDQSFAYWSYTQFGSDAGDAAKNTITRPWKIVTVALDSVQKRNTLGLLFGTFAFLPFASLPALILCVPLIAERVLSTIPAYWGTGFHYSATISPVLALGAVDGLSKLRHRFRLDGRLTAAFAAVALVPIVICAWLTFHQPYPLKRMTTAAGWERTTGSHTADAVLARIPAGASVTAQDELLPHLTHRKHIYDLTLGNPATDYVVANTTWPHYPTTDAQYREAITRFRNAGYTTLYARDGWLLLRRPGVDAGS
jgi:uncharacterized membrane protein